ncbi:hypothetical protein GGD65_001545 [Bradyrhizobium sp. CIR18]|uniref:hypothetical protein n=1 Tax=Bradyrhizobium sp. CIR18 TaxID=2663839 RepID=UPI001605BC74|nr:hypothetical protein [Bradyrhizobium sp. CIR18]MBB4360547.1 hypothetical protein [Bradyrhizobium sp. CIR18]
MKRLILTSAAGANLAKSKLAEIVVLFFFRFTWGPLPSSDYFAAYFGAQSGTLRPGDHWSDWGTKWPSKFKELRKLPFADFCERYDEIELWFDPSPDDQLQLIWLLDYLASYPELLKKLRLRLLASDLFDLRDRVSEVSASHIPMVDVQARELSTARMAWQAYRTPTPEACANLLWSDLSALLMLRPALQELLAELPSSSTGLGATEMRFLELLSRGFANTNALFHLRSQRRTYVFSEFDLGSLLEGLALGPRPAVAGLGDELRTIDHGNLRARHEVYLRSRLSLTEFGKAVLAHQEDFSRYNPIDRWWGGTHLTNDKLWRYGAVLTKP